jgi:hypothetical protein
VPNSRTPAALLWETAQEVGRWRWLLQQVVTLADEMPHLTDEQLRDRLAALAVRAQRDDGTASSPDPRPAVG